MKPALDQKRLKEVMEYDPWTGIFEWRVSGGRRVPAGHEVSGLDSAGYIGFQVDGVKARAHRFAWLYMTGKWPEHQIDHKNRIKSDNRWLNIRQATKKQNQQNLPKQKRNTSGYKGVFWSKNAKKWLAQIGVDSKQVYLGYFALKEDAAKAYASAAAKFHTHNTEAA